MNIKTISIQHFNELSFANTPTILIPFLQNDDFAAHLNTAITQYQLPNAISEDFKGNAKEVQVIYQDNRRLILLGLGKKDHYSNFQKVFRAFGFHHKAKFSTDTTLYLDANAYRELWQIQATFQGLALSTYDINVYKTKEKIAHPFEGISMEVILSDAADQPAHHAAAAKGFAIGESQKEAMRLVDRHAGDLKPTELAAWTQQSAEKYGYQVTVLNKAQSKAEGLEAFLAVNRGSEFEPAFIIAEYHPSNEAIAATAPKIGMVGKGVTFDTGGLNIKTRGMIHMKSDMGGSAAVLGTIELVAKLELPVHLTVIVPATDNAVDALSIRPSDVIGSYSGKTIEIIDTDAEGRLTLIDGIAYMLKNYAPDYLFDAATLTGASVRSLGYHAGALFGSNPALTQQIKAIGERIGERVWELPLYAEYLDELQSDVADIRNLGARPMAGASTAAKFIEFFTEKHPNWIHLDIAGVAFGDSEFSKFKAGTGFGVHLFTALIAALPTNH